MTELARYLSGTAKILLRNTLEKLATQQRDSEHYVARVYQALMLAHDAGFRTGVAIEFTDASAHVVEAVIQLPTDIVTFRMPFFLGTIATRTEETQAKAIQQFLAEPPMRGVMDGAPTDPIT